MIVVRELEDLKLLTAEELKDSGFNLGRDIIDPLLSGSNLYDILSSIIEEPEPEVEPEPIPEPEPEPEIEPEPIPEPEPEPEPEEEEEIPEEEEVEPEPEKMTDDGEPLYEYDDFIGTAIEFCRYFRFS